MTDLIHLDPIASSPVCYSTHSLGSVIGQGSLRVVGSGFGFAVLNKEERHGHLHTLLS